VVLAPSSSLGPLLLPLRFLAATHAMSTLASVVSDGSPGSCVAPTPFTTFSPLDERRRFEGGFVESIELPAFLCLRLVDSGAVVSPSSPDASRDDACCI
jgi:hypothetical protein